MQSAHDRVSRSMMRLGWEQDKTVHYPLYQAQRRRRSRSRRKGRRSRSRRNRALSTILGTKEEE